jgi:hypothetical protein
MFCQLHGAKVTKGKESTAERNSEDVTGCGSTELHTFLIYYQNDQAHEV